ncbi:hypothetical protein VPH35_078215 [Triticum aestivum]
MWKFATTSGGTLAKLHPRGEDGTTGTPKCFDHHFFVGASQASAARVDAAELQTTAKMLQSAYKNATSNISFAGTSRASATTARRSCIDNKNCYDQPVLLLEPVERPRRRRGGAASITKIATSNIYFCWNRSGVDDDSEAKLHPRQKLLRPTSIFAGTSRATERRSCIHNKFCYDGLMFLLEPA